MREGVGAEIAERDVELDAGIEGAKSVEKLGKRSHEDRMGENRV